ncbi:hypothetical protein H1P_6410009 [Hyella patelloides LEGE 07179]|uniref:Uncharacterized protein n=1 Tax=Hyella patelloides LEGE 07179 TaxID=945734 RepID=A0A563W272_9CYAN|nr:hypothetical protein [Hyella patelloides]VEP17778.1 hypothetical protein H1P_6410009 [Hyella patelloides LEGE 07179]
MSLSDTIRLEKWSSFKYVYSSVQAIAQEVRKEYRRKEKTLVSLIAVRPIKAIISPLSLLMNHRYNDTTIITLLNEAVKRLHTLALALESFHVTTFVARLREIAAILCNFMPANEGVQLELFNPDEYHIQGVA